MQVEQFDDRENDHHNQEPMRPDIGLFVARSVVGCNIAPGSLPDRHEQADFPVDQALGLKNQDHQEGVSTDHEYLHGVGVHQAVMGVQHHHRQEENAHAHLNEPAVEPQRQVERDGDPGIGFPGDVGAAQPAAGLDQNDEQHHHHEEAEDVFELFIAHINGDDYANDRPDDIEGYGQPASAEVELAVPPECNRAGGALRKDTDAVGAVGEVARQADQLSEDGQGDGRTVTRQGVDAAGQGASQDRNEIMVPFQLHGVRGLEGKDRQRKVEFPDKDHNN